VCAQPSSIKTSLQQNSQFTAKLPAWLLLCPPGFSLEFWARRGWPSRSIFEREGVDYLARFSCEKGLTFSLDFWARRGWPSRSISSKKGLTFLLDFRGRRVWPSCSISSEKGLTFSLDFRARRGWPSRSIFVREGRWLRTMKQKKTKRWKP
jgi:hypothetical protein